LIKRVDGDAIFINLLLEGVCLGSVHRKICGPHPQPLSLSSFLSPFPFLLLPLLFKVQT
jgi:hypothetical protein